MIKSLHFQVIIVLLFVLSATFAAAQVKTNGANLDLGNANIVNGGTGNFSNGISITGGSLNLNARSITNVQDFGMNGAGQFIIGASSGDKIVMNGGNITSCGNLSFNSSKTLDMNSGTISNIGSLSGTLTFTGLPTFQSGINITGGALNMGARNITNANSLTINSGGQIVVNGSSGNKIDMVGGGDINMNGGNITNGGTVTTSNLVATVSCSCPSDMRFKKDITTLSNALDKIKSLRGVNYNWRTDEFPEKGFSSEYQIGFIAQELEQVFPEFVYDVYDDGFKTVDYAKLTPVLVEAVKEQQTIIEAQQKELEAVKAQLEKVEALNAAYAELASRLDKLEGKMIENKSTEVGEE